ncbi:MAG: TonB-dependent receptor [Chitinophagaceae bacterium]
MNCLKKSIRGLIAPCILIFILLSNGAIAQTKKITGTVTDADKEVMAGVVVTLKGTNTRTVTDENGRFAINGPETGAVLQFSFVGYLSQDVNTISKSIIDISLKKDSKILDDVTVIAVGYGNLEKRADLTGSIGKVGVKDLQKAPVRSFEEALAGRVAGVQVLSQDGQPGDALNIVIRGGSSINNSNAPLFVIDGLPVEDPNNNNLNPAEIESITILKDASSTAIYGSRAANGVVIITTKQGKTGKAVISYSNYFGNNITTGRVNLMNAADFVRLQFEMDSTFTNSNYFNLNGATGLRIDSTKPIYSLADYENAPSLDFQNKLFENAPFQNHFLSVSGGNSAGNRYLFSGGYTDQKGVIISSGFKRYQGRLNVEQQVNDRLKITANINYASTQSYGTLPREQESQNSLANNPSNNLLFRVWGYRPTNINFGNSNLDDAIFDNEQGAGVGANLVINPFLSAQNQYDARFTNTFSASTITSYKISNSLDYRLNASVSIANTRAEKFDNELTNSGIAFGPNGSLSNLQTNNFSLDNILTYNKIFSKKTKLTLIGLASQQWRKNYGSGFSSNNVLFSSLGVGGLPSGVIQPAFDVNISDANLLGFGSTANLNLLDKYIFKASFRADGSSKFAPGKRWGYFPSVGFAWKVSEEKFMNKVKAITNVKFRINYGETGNNRISDFPYLSPFSQTNTSGFVYNNTYYSGFFQTGLGNRNLKWETTGQFDAGVEFGLLKDKVSVEVDYYRKNTRDLLLNAKFPLSSGYSQGLVNVGKISNEGLEFTLNANLVTSKNFTWNSNFNISFNRNRLIELADGGLNLIDKAETKNTTFNYISQIGQAVGLFYGFTYEGVYQYSDFTLLPSGVYVLKDNIIGPNGGLLGYNRVTVKPGDPRYKDINNDGLIDDNDQGIIGQSTPKAIGGFNNNFTLKNLSLNLFFQYAYGGQNLNVNRYYFENPSRLGLNQFASYNNRWSPTNPTNYAPRAGASGTFVNSSRIVESSSFLRFKTAQVSYRFGPKLIKKVGLKSLALNASAQNLLTITNYTGPDPEVNTKGTGLTPAYDFSAYPRAFTYTFGLNMTF